MDLGVAEVRGEWEVESRKVGKLEVHSWTGEVESQESVDGEKREERRQRRDAEISGRGLISPFRV